VLQVCRGLSACHRHVRSMPALLRLYIAALMHCVCASSSCILRAALCDAKLNMSAFLQWGAAGRCGMDYLVVSAATASGTGRDYSLACATTLGASTLPEDTKWGSRTAERGLPEAQESPMHVPVSGHNTASDVGRGAVLSTATRAATAAAMTHWLEASTWGQS
jgi:hypothetical protein